MPQGFQKIRFSAPDQAADIPHGIGAGDRAFRGAASRDSERSFTNDEAAARFYLGRIFDTDERPRVRGLAAPERPEAVPDLRLRFSQVVPSSLDRMLMFEQTHSKIPIFGSRVAVQLDAERKLVGVDGDVAAVSAVSPVASLSPAQALEAIAKLTQVEPAGIAGANPPDLVFFHDRPHDTWHLAYFFTNVPAVPPTIAAEVKQGKAHGHGLGRSPRELQPLMNYLVDAHDAQVLFFYSAAPMAAIPVVCEGQDELGRKAEFWGSQAPTGFEMVDPRRAIKTLDMKGKDLVLDPIPKNPVSHTQAQWQAINTAAVSAHVHATKVYNFYKSVLLRDGIDDKGMELVSVVNVTYGQSEPPPQWHNAVWYDNKMWYGRSQVNGSFESFARYLDVIAHELTHGVTQFTSGLVYKDQSGALNESFSDIFGVVIANWDPKDPDRNPATWDWRLGAGLGGNGAPLRDLSDPKSTGDPDHMNQYLHTPYDSGGVHTNSNIHNKAAYNVFMAVDAHGVPVFPPMEAAELFYQTLTRLSSLADFSDALQELVAVATIFYSGTPVKRAARVACIRDAYAKVGIV